MLFLALHGVRVEGRKDMWTNGLDERVGTVEYFVSFTVLIRSYSFLNLIRFRTVMNFNLDTHLA